MVFPGKSFWILFFPEFTHAGIAPEFLNSVKSSLPQTLLITSSVEVYKDCKQFKNR